MQTRVEYSIVIPSYKEAENLRVILPEVNNSLKDYNEKFEIIVVDTHEKLDGTEVVCQENNAKYINRIPTDVYGDAVRSGIAKANGKWIIFMDADGSHPPDFIPKLIGEVSKNDVDVAIASRYIVGGDSENSKMLVWMSKSLNKIYTGVLCLKCLDISNSFKIYRANYLKSIKLRCRNFDIVEEIVFELSWKYPNLTIKEIPFLFKKRLHGESKRSMLVFIYSYLTTLVKFCWTRYFRRSS